MDISRPEMQCFVNENLDSVVDDYTLFNEFCEAIIKFNHLFESGHTLAAVSLIRSYSDDAVVAKSHIDHSFTTNWG